METKNVNSLTTEERKEIFNQIRQVISHNHDSDVIYQLLDKVLTNREDQDFVIKCRSRYNSDERQRASGVLSLQEINIYKNNYIHSLLFIVNTIEQSESNKIKLSEVKSENTKNIVKKNKYKRWLTAIGIVSIFGIAVTGWAFFKLENDKSHITLFGSGSVYSFLLKNTPDLFKKSYDILFSPIEIHSGAAKAVISSSYQRGEEIDNSNKFAGVLGMSASELKSEDFKKNRVYGFKIGYDTALVTIGIKKQSIKNSYYSNIKETTILEKEDLLSFISNNDSFKVYSTTEGSGTLDYYIKCLPDFDWHNANNKLFNPFNLSNKSVDSLKIEKKSWIILGGDYYTLEQRDSIELSKNFVLYNFRLKCSEAKPLFLYFKLTDNWTIFKPIGGNPDQGYVLYEKKSTPLKQILDELGILETIKENNNNDRFRLKLLENGQLGIRFPNTDAVLCDDFSGLLKDKKLPIKSNKRSNREVILIFIIGGFFLLIIGLIVYFYFYLRNNKE
jgi:hypothetical protein